MVEPIFIPDGDVLVPQPGACGPWFPGVQHGGAIAGLFARAIETTPSAQPMITTRLSIDMSRKVPMGPTRIDTEIVRDGRRVQAVECRYVVDDEVVARASAMRIRLDGDAVPEGRVLGDRPDDMAPGTPGDLPEMVFTREGTDFVQNFTMRRDEPEPGLADTWLRLEAPFVAGEETAPAVRLAMIADMIPSAGSVVDFDTHLSINPDLAVAVHRLPEGEWIGSRAVVRVSADGFGQTDAQLFDQRGAIGRSIKSLLIDPR